MHPAGLEPATRRLRGGSSAVELRVRYSTSTSTRPSLAPHPRPAPPHFRPRRCHRYLHHVIVDTITSLDSTPGRARTFNLRFRRPALFRLSYQCVAAELAMRRGRIERPTSPLSAECSATELT